MSDATAPQTFDPALDVDGPVYDLGGGIQTDSPEIALEVANQRIGRARELLARVRALLVRMKDGQVQLSPEEASELAVLLYVIEEGTGSFRPHDA